MITRRVPGTTRFTDPFAALSTDDENPATPEYPWNTYIETVDANVVAAWENGTPLANIDSVTTDADTANVYGAVCDTNS